MRFLLLIAIMSYLPVMGIAQQYRYDTQEKPSRTSESPARPYSYDLPPNTAGVQGVERVQPLPYYDNYVNAQQLLDRSTGEPPVQTEPPRQAVQPAGPYSYDLQSVQPAAPEGSQIRPSSYDYDLSSIQPGLITDSPYQPVASQRPDFEKPAYCQDFPELYDKSGGRILVEAEGGGRTSLPRFASRAVKEYKVQCAILKKTHPANYPFHPLLIARWRPCEEVWVVESRKTFKDRGEADQHRQELEDLGYRGAYIIEMIGYEADQ